MAELEYLPSSRAQMQNNLQISVSEPEHSHWDSAHWGCIPLHGTKKIPAKNRYLHSKENVIKWLRRKALLFKTTSTFAKTTFIILSSQ